MRETLSPLVDAELLTGLDLAGSRSPRTAHSVRALTLRESDTAAALEGTGALPSNLPGKLWALVTDRSRTRPLTTLVSP